MYDYHGNQVSENVTALNYDLVVKAVAHRGYSSTAPENTLPAYRLAKANGFYYVETDVSFTSDGVPVCLHDSTIDRTSNGTGNINSLTWAQVQTYDFGSWKSSSYAGTKIPSLTQFLKLCRDIGLYPYIELKNSATYSEAQIQSIVDLVEANGLKGKVTYISFSDTYLGYVKSYDASARLGYLSSSVNSTVISTVQGLKTTSNEVYLGTSSYDSSAVSSCKSAHIPMEVWTIDSESTIKGLDPYITGVMSNSLIAGKVLYDEEMS